MRSHTSGAIRWIAVLGMLTLGAFGCDTGTDEPSGTDADAQQPDEGQPDEGQPDEGQPDEGQPDEGQDGTIADVQGDEGPTEDATEDTVEDTVEDAIEDTVEDTIADTTTTGFTVCTPEEGVATDITLDIYSDGWGNLLESRQVATEGSVTISVEEENPYNDPPTYYIYASAEGFYTELYYVQKGNPIDVDLDAVGDHPGAVAGSIFATQSFFADSTLSGYDLTVKKDGVVVGSFKTDGGGRYCLEGLEVGAHTFDFDYQEEPFSLDVNNTADQDYQDLYFAEPMQAAKPNIYLYPPETTEVSVTLGFPAGGHVTVSDPAYDGGWRVSVSPEGRVDGAHDFLFYESNQPTDVALGPGWLLSGDDLDGDLSALLARLGFRGREIADFTEFWTPRLAGDELYAVFPLVDDAVDALITLDVQPTPDAVRRVLLFVRPLDAPMALVAPDVPAFERQGFTVVEWGILRELP